MVDVYEKEAAMAQIKADAAKRGHMILEDYQKYWTIKRYDAGYFRKPMIEIEGQVVELREPDPWLGVKVEDS